MQVTHQLIFISSPYSHPDIKVKNKRVKNVIAYIAYLLSKDIFSHSPVVSGLPIAKAHKLSDDWNFWNEYCITFMERCDCVFVLMLEGWKDSTGVQAEIEAAKKLNKPVFYINPYTYQIEL